MTALLIGTFIAFCLPEDENINIPAAHGNPINIVINIEKATLLFAVFISFVALAAAIAGTNAVANAMLKDNGSDVSVSTFPVNIPYCAFAISSDKKFFNPLTIVTESIFLFKDDNIEINLLKGIIKYICITKRDVVFSKEINISIDINPNSVL